LEVHGSNLGRMKISRFSLVIPGEYQNSTLEWTSPVISTLSHFVILSSHSTLRNLVDKAPLNNLRKLSAWVWNRSLFKITLLSHETRVMMSWVCSALGCPCLDRRFNMQAMLHFDYWQRPCAERWPLTELQLRAKADSYLQVTSNTVAPITLSVGLSSLQECGPTCPTNRRLNLQIRKCPVLPKEPYQTEGHRTGPTGRNPYVVLLKGAFHK
jgi:hypothetical protein